MPTLESLLAKPRAEKGKASGEPERPTKEQMFSQMSMLSQHLGIPLQFVDPKKKPEPKRPKG